MHRSVMWFPLALLAVLAALTFWIDRTVQPPEPKRDSSTRHDMDYKLNNFSTTRTDLHGNPRYVLSATELVHYPDDDSTQLVRPRFTQYAIGKPSTQVQGQRGLVSSNGENVYIMDHVTVVRAAEAGRGEMTMLTEYLHVVPDQDFAETDHPVSILQAPHTVVKAQGMQYYKKDRLLKLAGRVYVHYERPKAAAPLVSASSAQGDASRDATHEHVKEVEAKGPSAQRTRASAESKKSHAAKHSGKHEKDTGKTTTRVRRHYEKSTS
jgi:lipopolysaccharide export system protein LptC